MSRRIAQGQQRIELLQVLLSLLSLHGLRLINNQNRIRLCNDINRPAGPELIQLHTNTSCIFASCIKRLRVDNHGADGVIRRKTINLCQLSGIIDEKAYLLTIFLGKMLLRYLKGLIHALADGNTGHNHDELAPTVMLVQLIHCLDIGICLADTGLHLNGQIEVPLQLRRRLELICPLYLLQVFQNNTVRKLRHDLVVAPTSEILFISHCLLVKAISSVHHV